MFISLILEKVLPFPIAISTTDNLPSVIVPVLSLNKILKLPAVSRPFIFLTRTLSFAILKLWNDNKMEVNIGNPSGTAQTIIVTATVIESISNRIHPYTSAGVFPENTVFNKIPAIIQIAPI